MPEPDLFSIIRIAVPFVAAAIFVIQSAVAWKLARIAIDIGDDVGGRVARLLAGLAAVVALGQFFTLIRAILLAFEILPTIESLNSRSIVFLVTEAVVLAVVVWVFRLVSRWAEPEDEYDPYDEPFGDL